jgi:hypothetical protein
MAREETFTYAFRCDEPQCSGFWTDDLNARPLSDDQQIDVALDHGWAHEMRGGREFWQCPDHSGAKESTR